MFGRVVYYSYISGKLNNYKHQKPNIMCVVATVTHPKTKELSVDITEFELDGVANYYYDEDGDWYSEGEEWMNNEDPLEACKNDAMDTLNQKYNGTYYSETVGERSERLTFSAMA